MDRRRLQAALIGAIALFASGVAQAGPVEEGVTAARAALRGGDLGAATAALRAAEAAAPTSPTVVSPSTAAAIWYYRGVVAHLQKAKSAVVMDAWRQALIIDNSLAWENGIVPRDEEPWALFESLRAEVRGRPTVGLSIPEKVGRASLYVDGVRVRAGDTVREGKHLAQITCDDGSVRGTWTTFAKDPRWLKLCPNGVDVNAAPAVAVATDDFGDLGPTFGSPPPTPPQPIPTPPAASPPPSASASAGVDPLRLGLFVGGGALLAGGTALNFLLVNPAWEEVAAAQADPAGVDAAEAAALARRFNVARFTTLGLLVGGGAAVGGAFFVEDARLVVGPQGLGLTGHF